MKRVSARKQRPRPASRLLLDHYEPSAFYVLDMVFGEGCGLWAFANARDAALYLKQGGSNLTPERAAELDDFIATCSSLSREDASGEFANLARSVGFSPDICCGYLEGFLLSAGATFARLILSAAELRGQDEAHGHRDEPEWDPDADEDLAEFNSSMAELEDRFRNGTAGIEDLCQVCEVLHVDLRRE